MYALALLKNIPLFSGLPEADLRVLQQAAARHTFVKGATIIREGSTGESLYLIVAGKVKVVLGDSDGKEVILAIRGSGDFMGEMALIDDEPRSAGVVTMEETSCMVFSRQAFLETVARNPGLSINLMKGLTQRLREANRRIESLALLDVYGRVARTLLSLARPVNGQLMVADRLTHKDIAGMVGASREMVSRIFKDLTNSGFIRVQGRQILINEKAPRLPRP